ncbi:hypothetical protein H6776_01155 [Candidatus Nomurabacteria bacterium]|nr:hypothetical protein [Candidatus Nomurabacteria bacterium]
MKTTTQPLKYTFIALTTALLTTAMTVFAAPFTPGQTLDPGCNPGDVDCYVSAGGSDTDWTQNGAGVWNDSDNIGIGTNNPSFDLEVQGDVVTQQSSTSGQQYLVNSQDTITTNLPAYDALFGAPNAFSGPMSIAGAYKTEGDAMGAIGVFDNSQWGIVAGDDIVSPTMLFIDESTQDVSFLSVDDEGFSVSLFKDPAGLFTGSFLNFNSNGLQLGSMGVGQYTLPLSDGTSGQTLVTDGSGNLNWASIGAGGVTVSNGLSTDGVSGDVELGGSLTQNTDIDGASTYYLNLNNLSGFAAAGNEISLSASENTYINTAEDLFISSRGNWYGGVDVNNGTNVAGDYRVNFSMNPYNALPGAVWEMQKNQEYAVGYAAIDSPGKTYSNIYYGILDSNNIITDISRVESTDGGADAMFIYDTGNRYENGWNINSDGFTVRTQNNQRLHIDTQGIINMPMPTYADDTAAGAGGLQQNDLYKTPTGEVRIKL